MSNDVTTVEYVGPIEKYVVVVDGWRVPLLSAHVDEEGDVHLVLDGRFGVAIPGEIAQDVVSFIAHSIAVASGYACHPSGHEDELTERDPLAPVRVRTIDSAETDREGRPARLELVKDDEVEH